MSHTTYIIGAGASHEAFPLNNGLLGKIKDLLFQSDTFLEGIENKRYLDTFRRTYIPLIEELNNEYSIDTLALEHIEDAEKLHYIKVLLWLFFSGNAGKKILDKRYKPLLLNLRDKSSNPFRLRQDVSFLSWNYDLQVEEVYANLSGTELVKVPNMLYTYPSVKFVNPGALNKKSSSDLFQLIHLNGCGGFYYDQERKIYDSWYNCDFSQKSDFEGMLDLVIKKFHTNGSFKNALTSCLNFAGEINNQSYEKDFYTRKVAEKTTHLISIGYSFPDNNRQIDTALIDQMENLEYIFIQAKNADEVERKLLTRSPLIRDKINTNALALYKDYECSGFHIPPTIN